MGTGVAGWSAARSLEICGDSAGPSSQVWQFRKRKGSGRKSRPLLTCARSRRFALSASIENVLIAVAGRASDRLKLERPEFSAAMLNRLACFVPPLFGIASILALFTSASMILLGALVVLPTAFRILLVVCQASSGGRRSVRPFLPMKNCLSTPPLLHFTERHGWSISCCRDRAAGLSGRNT